MKNLISLFFLLLLLASTNVTAQQDSTVSFVAYWQKGETRQFKITKKKVQTRDGKEITNNFSSYMASVTVLDSTEESYLLEWKYENKLFDSAPSVQTQFNELGDKYKFLTIKYKTDALGAYQGIQNAKEISKMINDMFDLSVKNYKGENPKAFEQTLEPMRKAMSSKEGLEQILFKEIHYIHSPFGAMYSLTDTVRYDDQLPNLFGGAPINAVATLHFNEADSEKQKYGYIHQIKPTTEDSKRMVLEMMEKMINNISDKALREKRKSDMGTALKDLKMEMEDTNVYSYDLEASWPLFLSTKRTVNVKLPEESVVTVEETTVERIN